MAAPSVTTKDLFAEDSSSSSSDEDEGKKEEPQPEKAEEVKTTEESSSSAAASDTRKPPQIQEDSSSDDSNDEDDKMDKSQDKHDKDDTKEKDATEKEEVSEKEATTRKPQIQDDSNSDEDSDDDDDEKEEATFDDAAADIRGESAPAGESLPKATTTTTKDSVSDSTRKKKRERLSMKILDYEKPPPGITMHMTKLPSMLVGIQPNAFDPDTYNGAAEEEEYASVHNMIRWRYKRDHNSGKLERDSSGKLIRESNARIVQWDNGSYTLHVGNEVFEVDSLKTATKSGFAGINGYLYQSQPAEYENQVTHEKTSGGTILESMGKITSKLTVRPSSLQSEAHKNLTVAVRQRNMKKARIAEYVTQEDPEKAKAERIKVKAELAKASARKQHSYKQSRRSMPAMNRRYLEEEEDDGRYDSVNIGDLKRRREEEEYDYGQDSEDEEEDEWERQRLSRKRRRGGAGAAARKQQEEDEEEEDIVMQDDSSDEEDEQINRVSRSKPKKRSVFEDDD